MTHFDGETFDHDRDGTRLDAQHQRVRNYTADGQWHTLAEISEATGDPEASVSARLRDLRKVKWGAMTVERRFIGNGLHEYRVLQPPPLWRAVPDLPPEPVDRFADVRKMLADRMKKREQG